MLQPYIESAPHSPMHKSQETTVFSSRQNLTPDKMFFVFHVIRECGTTLYVGLARVVPPNSTNFRLTFLLTRFQEALYKDLAV